MEKITITPEGAKALETMVLSCGNITDCKEMMRVLSGITRTVQIALVAVKPSGTWYVPFRRLAEFAQSYGITEIGPYEVVAYFGSDNHAQIMQGAGAAKIGQYLGPDVGLVAHVAMPLDEDLTYRNSGKELRFVNYLDLGGEGVPIYHLGAIVRLSLDPEQVQAIKDEQKSSSLFWEALCRISDRAIELPPEYLAGVCLTNKTATE